MEPIISVQDSFLRNHIIACILDINYPERVWVGCSIMGPDGKEHGLRLHGCDPPYHVVWRVEFPHCCASDTVLFRGWTGKIIFAVWNDAYMSLRLADTGWIPFRSPDIVHSSGAYYADQSEIDRFKPYLDLPQWT